MRQEQQPIYVRSCCKTVHTFRNLKRSGRTGKQGDLENQKLYQSIRWMMRSMSCSISCHAVAMFPIFGTAKGANRGSLPDETGRLSCLAMIAPPEYKVCNSPEWKTRAALTAREFPRGGCCRWLLSVPEAAKTVFRPLRFFTANSVRKRTSHGDEDAKSAGGA